VSIELDLGPPLSPEAEVGASLQALHQTTLASFPLTPRRERLPGAEIAGRYIVGPQLTRSDIIETFDATDLWLDRQVALAIGTRDNSHSLLQLGRLVAGIDSSHVVHVFACGSGAGQEFVIFERPVFTLAFLAREARLYEWGAVEAIHAARALLVGLEDLRGVGVGTHDIHLGSIGIDGVGRVRLSPWALGYSQEASNSGDGDLIASVLETAVPDASGRMSKAGEIAFELRLALSQGDPLTVGEIVGVLDEEAGRPVLPLEARTSQ
jgi:hypothetical protein